MNENQGQRALIIVFVLVLLAAIYRLLPHPHNFAPITGIALLSGSFLRKHGKIAFILPLVAIFLSDLVLNNTLYSSFYPEASGIIFFAPYMIATFLSIIVITGLGKMLKRPKMLSIVGASIASSLIFFLITNMGSWLELPMYPKTLAGLGASITAGLPFFQFTILGDLVFSVSLFGIAAFAMNSFKLTIPWLRSDKL